MLISLNIPLSGEMLSLQSHTAKQFCVNGWKSNRHNNSLDELHIILSGSCQLEVEDSQHHLLPGSVILVRAGKFHGPPNVQQDVERCSFLLNVTKGSFLDHQLDLLSNAPVCVSDDVIRLCRELDSDAAEGTPYYKDMLAAKLTLLIIKILQTVNANNTPDSDHGEDSELHNMLCAIDRFFSRFPNEVGSEVELARKFNISRHKLNRIIYQNYGVCFRDKMRKARMDYASWLLRRTDYSCKHIASLCGYSADTSFHKAFRDNFGIAPLAYRKLYSNIDPLFQNED